MALERSLDEVAKELATVGIGERQAENHAIESQQFALHLKALRDEEQKLFEEQVQELEALGYTWHKGILAQWKEPSKPKSKRNQI